MSKSELIHTLSFDLKFFSHDTSKKVVEYAAKNKVVGGEDKIRPLFDLDSIEVQPNFKPDVKKLFSSSLFDELIEKIAEKIGKSHSEVVAMINERQEKFSNLLAAEVVALIMAKEVGIDIVDYVDKVEKEVLGEGEQKERSGVNQFKFELQE